MSTSTAPRRPRPWRETTRTPTLVTLWPDTWTWTSTPSRASCTTRGPVSTASRQMGRGRAGSGPCRIQPGRSIPLIGITETFSPNASFGVAQVCRCLGEVQSSARPLSLSYLRQSRVLLTSGCIRHRSSARVSRALRPAMQPCSIETTLGGRVHSLLFYHLLDRL